MKILIVTLHFYPENFKCNDMAFELARRGHDVSVMTAIPDYPGGKFFGGCGIFKKRREKINGVTVHRSMIVPRGKGGAARLFMNYLSYTFFASAKALWFGLTRKYDAVIVHETSPVLVGIPGVIIKRMQKIPQLFWVLDLWPESLSAAGNIRNGTVLGAFERLTKWLYRNSERILIGSKGFRESICRKGDFDGKITYFPNWVDEVADSDEKIPAVPEGFNVVFTGNMGDAQDFPNVLKAARLLRDDKDINFIFVGDGRRRDWVLKKVKELGLDNVFCPGKFPREMMSRFYEKASVLFLSLKDSEIFSLTVPAKLQAYMSSGKPVVAMINGEGANLIRESDSGWAVPAESPESLASLLKELRSMDEKILEEKGENGKRYSRHYFSFRDSMDSLEDLLLKAVEGK